MAASTSPPAKMRAIVLDTNAHGKLVIGEVARPQPGPSEALVRVAAISINRGEVCKALATGRDGARLGWDLPECDACDPARGGDLRASGRTPGGRPYLMLHHEFQREKPAGLTRLVQLIAEGKLTAAIERQASSTEVAEVAAQLIECRFIGKAVLHI